MIFHWKQKPIPQDFLGGNLSFIPWQTKDISCNALVTAISQG